MRRHRRATLDTVGNAAAIIAYLAGELFEHTFRGLSLAHRAIIIDAGRHNRDTDDALEAFVEGGADNDVGILIDFLPNAGGGLVNFVKREVFAASDRDEQALGPPSSKRHRSVDWKSQLQRP